MNVFGAVPTEAAVEAFPRGRQVFLSIDVSGASTDQNIEVQWIDSEGRVPRRERRLVREGGHYAPFSSGSTARWCRAAHLAVVVINGRRVAQKPFEVS